MSNFEEKFNNWREKMNQKSERERHNFALTVSFVLGAIVFSFVATGWFLRFSGTSFETSFFTKLEEVYNTQKKSFIEKKEEFADTKNQFFETINASTSAN